MGALFLLAAIIAGIKLFTIQDAAQWFAYPAGKQSLRIETEQAPFGNFAFSLPNDAEQEHFGQSFAPGFIKPLRKKTFTLGVWIWADKPTELVLPYIQYRTPDGIAHSPEQTAQISDTPVFYTTTLQIPYEASHTWLTPLPTFPQDVSRIYYDGFVLAEGEYSSTPPSFENDSLVSGTWDGKTFNNIIRNPSAEHAWLGVNNNSQILKLRSYIEPALYLQTLQDIQGFGWYYQASISSLFISFWGQGAGSEIRLLGGFTYDILKVVSLMALLGSLFYAKRSSFFSKRPEMLFLLIVTLAIWMLTFFRGTYWVFFFVPLVPYARYAFPAFIPTLLLLNAGIVFLLQWLADRYKLDKSFPSIAFQTLMLSLAIFAVFTFGGHFYPIIQSLGFLILLLALAIVIFIALKKGNEIVYKNTPKDTLS